MLTCVSVLFLDQVNTLKVCRFPSDLGPAAWLSCLLEWDSLLISCHSINFHLLDIFQIFTANYLTLSGPHGCSICPSYSHIGSPHLDALFFARYLEQLLIFQIPSLREAIVWL